MACHPGVYGFLCDSMRPERQWYLSVAGCPLSFVAMESVMGLQLELAVMIDCPAQQTPGHGLPSLPNRLSVVGL